ncbi:glycosyltransferase family 4 protein [Candidatus Peregrinibacteria bacterium]|nr:MAG: glycosyltransferase family 4 protein [Candidatus Peregrinibacteria bacterium]
MKIGFNARFLVHPYTGIGVYTRRLVRALAEQYPDDTFLLFTPELVDVHLPANCQQIRVQERIFRSNSLQKAYWEHRLLPRAMEQHPLDLAHFLYPSNPRRALPFPVVVTVHDVIPWVLKSYRKRWRTKAYYLYAKWALKYAQHVLTVSRFSMNEIIQIFSLPKKRLTVTPLGPPNSDGLPLKTPALRRPFLLYVGGYDDRKNVPLLMKVFQQFVANDHAVDLLLVGAEGKGLEQFYSDQYFQKIDKRYVLKPKGNIIATPPLPDDDLALLYQQAIGLVHLSKYEGFNLTLLAAMQAGLPMLLSDIPAHREVADEAAWYVDLTDLDAIGQKMVELITHKKERSELAHLGDERLKSFSWESCAEKAYSVYKKISNTQITNKP